MWMVHPVAALVLAFVLVLAGPARAAAQVTLTIADGNVSLVADSATLAQVFDEWARVGETQIVNGDRVPGGPVTIRLDNVSEKEALGILLQSAAGFIAVGKSGRVAAGSRFGRILILPTSIVAPGPGRPAGPPQPQLESQPPPEQPSIFPGSDAQPVIGPDGAPVPDDQEGFPSQPPLPPGVSPPVDFVPVPMPPEAPGQSNTPGQTPQPPGQTPQSPQAPAAPVGAPVPGMVVPAPPPAPVAR